MNLDILSSRIGLHALMTACRRLGTALRAGLDVRRVCQQETAVGPPLYRRHMADMGALLEQGTNFADAVKQQGTYFPPLFRTMIQVGERSGKLPEVLLRLAEHYEHMIALRKIYLLGILWPAIQFVAATVIIGLLIWLMGPLSSMVGQPVDILGFGLVGNRGLIIYLTIVASAVAGSILLYKQVTGEGAWGQQVQRLALRIPILGQAMVSQIMARMTWSMAMIADSDLGSRTIARSTLDSSENSFYRGFAAQIDQGLRGGQELHEAFRAAGGFPDDFVQAVHTGELAGTLVETLTHLSRDYENRAKSAWAAVATAAAFGTWALVAMVLIFMIFRIASFYVNTIMQFAT